MELIILLAAFVIMLASLSGLLFAVARVGNWVSENLIYLNTFAAGVFTVIMVDLLLEAFRSGSTNVLYVALATILGFCLFFLAEWFLPESHCHHDDDNCVHTEGDKRKAWKVLISDAFHNAGDGIVLVPVFLINIQLGLVATVGIVIHEIVQGVAQFFILKRAGYSTLGALQRNFAISSTILIGVFLASVLTGSASLVGPLIGFAAGGFLHIIFIDLIPLSVREARENGKHIHFVVSFLLGVAVIFSVNFFSQLFLQNHGLEDHGHSMEDRA